MPKAALAVASPILKPDQYPKNAVLFNNGLV